MRRTASTMLFCLLAVAVPASAQAAPALRVGAHDHAHRVHDRLLPPRARTALPAVPAGTRIVRSAVRARTAAALPPADAKRYNDALNQARAARDKLPAGTPRTELAAVIATVEGIDRRGEVVPSRVNALVLTLQRNTQFWAANAAPAAGTRVQFTGSPVYFEYYPGQGLQIQPLANFGKANAAWSSCRSKGDTTCTTLRSLLDAMLSLAATRGGFSAWEYDFAFEGGVPPWMSGMAQATGIQALSRAYKLTGVTRYRDAATAALAAFETGPPTGIARPATNGTHYLMYSYAPDLFIFNGHYQALLGLDDYRDITGDPRGTTLFRAGHAHGRWLLPYADTGSWSLYSLGGPPSTVEYHTLLTDFIQTLCKRVGTPVYCDTAARFTQYLAARGG
jgi:D-glucuronyl C5-epimerase-like protein